MYGCMSSKSTCDLYVSDTVAIQNVEGKKTAHVFSASSEKELNAWMSDIADCVKECLQVCLLSLFVMIMVSSSISAKLYMHKEPTERQSTPAPPHASNGTVR